MEMLDFFRKCNIQNAQEFESYWDTKLKWEDFTAIHHELWNFCEMFQLERLEEGMEYMCELWRKTKEWEKEHPGRTIPTIRHAEDEFDVFNFNSLKK